MKRFAKYVINPNTVLIATEIDSNGQIHSKVIEGNKIFIVAMHPKSIIDYSLGYYCSSLKGAIEGARSILGNISMPPVMISSQLDVCWFPCFSPERSDCVWFSLTHVIRSEKQNARETKVYLNYGHTINLELKKERFEGKRQRASQLMYVSTKRTKRVAPTYVTEHKK